MLLSSDGAQRANAPGNEMLKEESDEIDFSETFACCAGCSY
jgi:hypothetical protein